MIDSSNNVLSLMKVVYAIYVTIVITMIGRYGIRITRQKRETVKICPFQLPVQFRDNTGIRLC